jgi:hypothetical protein
MSTGFNHLIAKHGILTSFSIARKVSKKDIKRISDKIKKQCKNKNDFNELLQKEVLKTTKYSMNQDLIPGLILSENEKRNDKKELADEKKLMQLNYVSNTIARKIMDNKMSKDEVCYIILNLLSALGLNDQDFKNFNKKYGNSDENMEDEDEDDEDDDEN